jgi:CMP-N-acetylneuraminic acid synthetase
MDKQSYLIIIPARKGSKSIKNKNIKLLYKNPSINIITCREAIFYKKI